MAGVGKRAGALGEDRMSACQPVLLARVPGGLRRLARLWLLHQNSQASPGGGAGAASAASGGGGGGGVSSSLLTKVVSGAVVDLWDLGREQGRPGLVAEVNSVIQDLRVVECAWRCVVSVQSGWHAAARLLVFAGRRQHKVCVGVGVGGWVGGRGRECGRVGVGVGAGLRVPHTRVCLWCRQQSGFGSRQKPCTCLLHQVRAACVQWIVTLAVGMGPPPVTYYSSVTNTQY